MSVEKWRPIQGWENEYDVGDLGNVRSRKTYHRSDPTPRPMRLIVDVRGYYIVRFSSPRLAKQERHRVHQLVTAAFLGPRPEGAVTRHLNGDYLDNRLENLTYGTQSENLADAVAHGTHAWSSRTHCKNGHEYTPENTRYKPSRAGRICIACDRARELARHQRRKAAA